MEVTFPTGRQRTSSSCLPLYSSATIEIVQAGQLCRTHPAAVASHGLRYWVHLFSRRLRTSVRAAPVSV